jgi:hypothetical protein
MSEMEQEQGHAPMSWEEAYWELTAITRTRVWRYRRGNLSTWLPWLGDDEYLRRTLVLGTPLTGHIVIALWHCCCQECDSHIQALRARIGNFGLGLENE